MMTISRSLAQSNGTIAVLDAAPSTLLQGIVAWAHRLWVGYWDHQVRRATVLMLESLDDRALKDIGLARSEIWSAVFGGSAGTHVVALR